jgi:DNA modification methylase
VIVQGDARRIPLADGVVQCVVTSPPYWGLRKYAGAQDLIWQNGTHSQGIVRCNRGDHNWESNGFTREHPDRSTIGKDANGNGAFGDERGVQDAKTNRGLVAALGDTCCLCGAWRGGFGLEPSIEMYIAHTVEILREIRRVLRPDGVVFWNIGDSYAGGGNYRGMTSYESLSDKQRSNRGATGINQELGATKEKLTWPLKPKDLCLIPERVAIAAQADGWWVRSMIIWAKPNPMPESCKDRPTDAYEHIIMLTKSERYFWDADAVREPSTGNTHSRGNGDGGPKARQREEDGTHVDWNEKTREVLSARNLRNVWTFPTQPYKGSHFATFPEEIPRRCILAATSERGACANCGAPWQRIVEKETHFESGSGRAAGNWHQNENGRQAPRDSRIHGKWEGGEQMRADDHDIRMGPVNEVKTIGWEATCTCNVHDLKPCIVLDPFGGSGTTARVAVELNRHAVSLDLAYHEHAERRTRHVQRRLAQTCG